MDHRGGMSGSQAGRREAHSETLLLSTSCPLIAIIILGFRTAPTHQNLLELSFYQIPRKRRSFSDSQNCPGLKSDQSS